MDGAEKVTPGVEPAPAQSFQVRAAGAGELRASRVRLHLAAFLVDAFTYTYTLTISAQAKSAYGASEFELGLLGTVAGALYTLLCLATGSWSDRRGSLPLMGLSLAIIGLVLFPLTLLSSSFLGLLVANACVRLTLGLFWPPLQRQLSVVSPGPVLWRSLGAFNLAWAVGSAVGNFGGPSAYDRFGFRVAIGFCIAAALLALLSTMSRSPATAAPPAELRLEDVDPARGRLFLRLAWVSNFCAYFALGGLLYLFIDVSEKLAIPGLVAAVILCSKDVTRFFAFLWLRKSPRWHYSFAWLFWIQLLGGTALILSSLATSPVVLLLFFSLFGVYCGLSYYSSIYYGLNLRAEEGKRSGLHEGILSLGYCLGPLCSGAAGYLFPGWPGSALALPGVVILLGLGVMLWLARRENTGTIGEGSSIRR